MIAMTASQRPMSETDRGKFIVLILVQFGTILQ
jgi:hypothetical protein